MEVLATKAEIKSFLNSNAKEDYFVFPERRESPIKMENNLPQLWVKKTKVPNQLEEKRKKGNTMLFNWDCGRRSEIFKQFRYHFRILSLAMGQLLLPIT
ncbi:DUF6067 family protein [Sphingobacterium sp. E70]|nr:glycoside hydrolase domain-containing protein [Sphingobacterium sp. E70]ULT26643.1 DUF6067 family protein [Sphingobacterium sp. E70]